MTLAITFNIFDKTHNLVYYIKHYGKASGDFIPENHADSLSDGRANKTRPLAP